LCPARRCKANQSLSRLIWREEISKALRADDKIEALAGK
jgi:hypothetical protein